jgi:hypothetical protein
VRDGDATGGDIDRPSPARIVNYIRGGRYNLAVDREAADEVLRAWPGLVRGFEMVSQTQRRMCQTLAEEYGIDQFVELGSGIPDHPATHRIVQAVNPAARVVYVDVDATAVTVARQIVATNPSVALDEAVVLGGLDLARPVALISILLWHFLPDPEAGLTTTAYMARLAPGSFHAIVHEAPHEKTDRPHAVYTERVATLYPRDAAQIAALLDGLDLLPAAPGRSIVFPTEWRAIGRPELWSPGLPTGFAVLARKPGGAASG